MAPKNVAERRKALLTFLIFLVASTAIIVTTVYFSTDMPFRQVKQLNEQKTTYENDRAFSQRFTTAMVGVSSTIDSADKMTTPESLDPMITGRIASLIQMSQTDSAQNKVLYTTIASILTSLQQTKTEKRQAINASKTSTTTTNSNMEVLQSKLNSANNSIDQIQNLVNTWETQLPAGFVKAIRAYKAQ